MKIVNRHGLREAFVRAVENDPYTRGESDFSATGLETPARAAALIEKYKDMLEVDASTKVAVIIGQGTHSIVERAARPTIDICEKRYFAKFGVDGASYIVSAQIDLYETDTKCLYDWKTTKAYAFHKKAGSGKKPEWISQMNIGAEIMRRNGLKPESLSIIALLKDWDKACLDPNSRKRAADGTWYCPYDKDYPPTEVMAVNLPMWTSEETSKYIEDRIRAHVLAKVELPKCTSKESWGGRRCADYCDASAVCSQYQDSKKTGILTEE